MFTRGTGGTAVVRRMVQDRDGRLLGEYGTAGTQIFTEYIWLLPETSDGAQTYGGDDGTGGWTPLAVVTAPGNTTQTLLFLRSSHLGVPTGSTNATGTTTAIATGTTLLGFPGQQQTLADLYYNQYRDYDTVTGRYIQADPLGLDGDINPYAYAGGNPVRFMDAWGLFQRGLGFSNSEWSRFNAAQQRAAGRVDRSARMLELMASANDILGFHYRAVQQRAGAQYLRWDAEILRNTGSDAYFAHLLSNSAYQQIHPGASAGLR